MRIDELKEEIKNLTGEVRSLTDNKDLEGAKAKMEELRQAKETLKIEEELAEEEMRDLKRQKEKRKDDVKMENRKSTKEMELRAAVKFISGSKIEEEERALVTVSGNGALIPEEFINQIEVYRKGFPSLKKYCHVLPVISKTGKMPVTTLGMNTLVKLNSDDVIPEGAMATDKITYDIEDYGKFIPIEKDLEDDEATNIVRNVLFPDFAEGSVTAENIEIINILKTNSTSIKSATSYRDINKAIDKSLPTCKNGLIVITNQSGYCYLNNLEDKEGRNLNLIKIGEDGQDYFHNKPLITLDDEVLAPAKSGNLIFYVANLHELVKFFDRKQMVIDKSIEFLFNRNQDCLRAIERFDVVKGNTRSAKSIEFALPVSEVQ